MGKTGRYMVDFFLVVMQLGFLMGIIYFLTSNLQSVLADAAGWSIDIKWYGLFCLVFLTPLTFLRSIEKFAFSHVFADILILVTTIVIIVFATKNTADHGWG